MSITTYADLLTHLGRMVTFEAENPGDASVGVLQTVISLAEFRIYREIRTSFNMKAFGVSDVVTGNAMTLPSDFKAAAAVNFGKQPLQPVTPEFLQQYLQTGDNGECKYFANVKDTLQFAPAVGDGIQVQGYYYCVLPALSDSTLPSNGLFNAANDLFLFACMVEAAPIYGFQDQLQIWDAKYQMVRDRLNDEQAMNAYSAGRMKVRPSTTLMG